MNVLVTGNKGYIGPVLCEMLMQNGHTVIGYDTGYYAGGELYAYPKIHGQICKDVRDVTRDDLRGVDAVMHLAGLSNDPLGELAPGLTEDINFRGTLLFALCAREAGVKRFIYASSQSMYGIADVSQEVEEDSSQKIPVTAYARTKWDAEIELMRMSGDGFTITALRPSTVFGASPNLRCDIVFNNLVACAYTTGKIEIKSDGTPWRPVVHVRDVSNAFIACLEAPRELVAGESFNIGIMNGNYTVRDLAEAAQRSVPGSTLIFTGEHGADSRTYRVSFRKILTRLKDYYKPQWDLDRGGKELVGLFRRINFTEEQFRGRDCIRLKQIRYLLDEHKVNPDLRWTG
ncbi:MAG: NAD(P)-dependent oxidoreductase [Gammaproteobacteria bacterium]|nr:MAG: NAD(P)-dependent oxidoreductase [Gammaproteobacteria bacterium]